MGRSLKLVMIVGAAGSGKSTLARLLGERTGLPVFHMDHIHWQSGWIERSAAEKDRLTREVHAREAWIFEGGNSRTYPERMARADTLIWLDFPFRLRIWRIIRRTIRGYGQTRPDLPDGCPERLGKGTLEFFAYNWRTRSSTRVRHQTLLADAPPHVAVHHLKSLRDVRHFLATLPDRL